MYDILKQVSLVFLLSAWLILPGCNDEAEQVVLTPTNLSFGLNVSNDSSGNVTFSADAIYALRYQFNFGDGVGTEISDTDGTVTYSYRSSGTYTATVTAIGDSDETVSDSVTFKVAVAADKSPTAIPTSGFTSPRSYSGMALVWEDDFLGSTLNTADWNHEIGNGVNGWGNNELQYYRSENTTVRDGYLIIEAKEESFSGSNYTSSRITTQGKRDFQYGRVDIRAAMPKGQGLWPALWMLGSNIETVGWPASGEIDIMEMVGGDNGGDNTVYGTVHWQADVKADFGGNTSLPSGTFNDEFHVFSIIWTSNSIRWLLDDVEYHSFDTTPNELDEFRERFFFIFNVAVGGNWPGSPDGTTEFSQQMVVDYIRVFQDN